MYKFFRNLLFLFPAEGVHHFSMEGLKWVCKPGFLRRLVSWCCRPEENERKAVGEPGRTGIQAQAKGPGKMSEPEPGEGAIQMGEGAAARDPARTGELSRELFGLSFRNPVGLGAGFDKNALYLRELDALGFGFVEIGTVTPLPQAGNDRPRLFRLPEDQALINRMGFNNDGAEAIAGRLKKWREKDRRLRRNGKPLIIGGNIGKNKSTPNEEAWKDYEICFRKLFGQVDYFTVNVSSPNTPGLRELQEKEALRVILTNLQAVNRELALAGTGKPRPLLLKISPDLTRQQIDEVIGLVLEIKLDGLVVTNTTISREQLLSSADRLGTIGAGGLSGAPLKERSTALVRYIYSKTMGSVPLMASGGIFTGEDAKEKIKAGAALVQVWTGFIYEGPMITLRICRELDQ